MQKTLIGLVALGSFILVTFSAFDFIQSRIELTHGALHGARLVGHNCDGISGKLYGIEESEFPQCEKIELINKESE